MLGYKIYTLQKSLKENGFFYTFTRKIIPYSLRPVSDFLKRYQFFFEICYGFAPNLKQHFFPFQSNSVKLFLPKTELMEKVRKFWYSNTPGNFILDGELISRKEIFTYGGPNSAFLCSICQKAEWLSRVRQKNLFIPHSCPTAERCRVLCSRQGDDLWTHFHQNFDFQIGCDSNLPAPKGLYIIGKKEIFFALRLEPMERILRRQFAFACQLDVADSARGINWDNYDFLFVYNSGYNQKFRRPNIPVILFGHDFWPLENKGYQWVIDWLKPDVFLTTYPIQWKENFRLPSSTRVIFHPMFPSNFFTRPNLNQKSFDLLVIGNTKGSIYEPRRRLNKQISELTNFKIEFSHVSGTFLPAQEASLYQENPFGGFGIRYLNKWSEYLGSAKYVTFGRMKYPILLGKYYETLGSGAVPIFPEVPDLKLLNIKAFEHYIPLSEIEGNNPKLVYFLDNYNDFKYIAENAVKWYKENSDRMLFNNFEDLIREITNQKYPKRLI